MPYPTDLSDAEWQRIDPLLPAEKPIGKPREVDLRDVLDAIFYRADNGIKWRAMPIDFPAWQTVYGYYRKWVRRGVWESINALLVEGLLERCKLVGGNFLESVPSGGDAYLLKHIIHDWGDEQAIAILKNCHHAMPDQGKLLVVEMVIPSGNEPFFGKLLDLQVLVNYQGGCERTEAEYQVLFETAGFSLTKIVPTVSPLSVIEGIRIGS